MARVSLREWSQAGIMGINVFGLGVIALTFLEMATGFGVIRQLILTPEQIAEQDAKEAEEAFAHSMLTRRFVDCPNPKKWTELSRPDQDRFWCAVKGSNFRPSSRQDDALPLS